MIWTNLVAMAASAAEAGAHAGHLAYAATGGSIFIAVVVGVIVWFAIRMSE